MIYVSHAPQEVAQLADYLVMLDHGMVQAQGDIAQLLARLDLAPAFGEQAAVVVKGQIIQQHPEHQLTRLAIPGGEQLLAPWRPEPLGSRLRLHIKAQDVSLHANPEAGVSSLGKAIAVEVLELAATAVAGDLLVQLGAQGTLLLARINRHFAASLDVRPGRRLWASIRALQVLGQA